MPIFIIIFQTIKRKIMKYEYSEIEIDGEYTMITTKLEIILSFGIFCPLLYPVIIVSLNSFIYFYQFVVDKLKWKVVFLNYGDGQRSFPFHFLTFGILTQQILTVLFMISVQNDSDTVVLGWIILCIYILIDTTFLLKLC